MKMSYADTSEASVDNAHPAIAEAQCSVEAGHQRRSCLLVLGMHRSGTSALCGVLHELGGARPVREMQASPDNEKGYFEPSVISAIHDRMLDSAGLQWFDWEAIPEAWYQTAQHDAFVQELADAASIDFPGDGPFILKDPRVCRFPKIWLQIFDRLRVSPVVVNIFRDPAEVSCSLQARNGYPIAHGLLMWLRHTLEAEAGTRHVERSFINYADLLEDWQSELATVLKNDKILLPKSSARAFAVAGDFLDQSLKHQGRRKNVDREALHPWIVDAVYALQRLRVDPYDKEAMCSLDRIKTLFDSSCLAFTPTFHEMWLRLRQMENEKRCRSSDEVGLTQAEESLAVLKPLAERYRSAEADRDAMQLRLSTLEPLASRVQELELDLNTTKRMLDELEDEVSGFDELKLELEILRRSNIHLKDSLEAAVTQLDHLTEVARRFID